MKVVIEAEFDEIETMDDLTSVMESLESAKDALLECGSIQRFEVLELPHKLVIS